MFGHEKHKVPADAWKMNLCYLGETGYHCQDTKEYKKLTKDPHFVCKHCGKKAHSSQNLCGPLDLT